MRLILFALFASTVFARPAMAQVRIVPDQPVDAVAAVEGVDVFVVNEGSVTETAALPTRLTIVARDGSELTLYRVGDATTPVAPGGFVKWRYRNVDPVAVAAAKRAETNPDEAVPVVLEVQTDPDLDRRPAQPKRGETEIATSIGTRSGFADRFEPYEPIYGAFGAGDAGAKLQLSLAFRPFDGAGALDGVRVAWTQTLFWDIQDASGPIRETDYSPEVFYQLPVSDHVIAAVGYRHTSNGKGPVGSIDANRIYARASATFDLGKGWQADVTPQAWFYVGTQGIAPDLDRYLGYGSITAAIHQRDGLKLQAMLRGNPATGRGAGEVFASYPLAPLGGGFGLYAFGQAFTGYGEALSDYDVRSTHARIGIALTR